VDGDSDKKKTGQKGSVSWGLELKKREDSFVSPFDDHRQKKGGKKNPINKRKRTSPLALAINGRKGGFLFFFRLAKEN